MSQAMSETSGPPHVHHMDSTTAYGAAKLGMWLFLATEILLFGGLFCAFAVFRYLYLEQFHAASHSLNWGMGAFNTVVLIFSSFTAALSVSAAQQGDNAKAKKLILTTIVCGFGFLIIKYFEYKAKFHHGIFPGGEHAFGWVIFTALTFLALGYFLTALFSDPKGKGFTADNLIRLGITVGFILGIYLLKDILAHVHFDLASILPFGPEVKHTAEKVVFNSPEFNASYKSFFGLYYCMTGLHALHVLIGMLLLFWAYLKTKVSRFSTSYYTPVEISALYWHLVDLIWIYLFPLLYLVG